MRSILTALQEGRLFELPEAGKDRALEFLARILDANPDIEVGTDTIEEIQLREQECNTGIGMGVGVPHVRARREEGELFCAIGWSSQGIDYDAADGKPVHLVVMYYIPGAQKNVYLKEISSLVKAIRKSGGMEPIAHASGPECGAQPPAGLGERGVGGCRTRGGGADDQAGGQAGADGHGDCGADSCGGGGGAGPAGLAGGVVLGAGRAAQHGAGPGAGPGLGGGIGKGARAGARPCERRRVRAAGQQLFVTSVDAVSLAVACFTSAWRSRNGSHAGSHRRRANRTRGCRTEA